MHKQSAASCGRLGGNQTGSVAPTLDGPRSVPTQRKKKQRDMIRNACSDCDLRITDTKGEFLRKQNRSERGACSCPTSDEEMPA